MTRPLLLDLFCGAGGASVGYHRAGFDVVGVDLKPQKNYPFEFIQHDAIDLLQEGADFGMSDDIDVVHASPPCQAYSNLNAYNHADYPDLVGPVRKLLDATELPYVIENVPQAPLFEPMTLCGLMFGLKVYRHRGFESPWLGTWNGLPHPHKDLCSRNGYLPTPERPFMSIHGGKHSRAWLEAAKAAMDVPWMATIREVCESIPPAFTEYVGKQLIDALERAA